MSDTMSSAPIIDEVDTRRLDLIRKTVAKGCTDAEIASFLELAARYDLDPFAHEIWCAKDKGGRLLLMVGRDGLRKIAQRQGLYIDGDVVRAKDEFAVRRSEHGRVVHHAYGLPEERGEIVGAWCDVTDTAGRSVGYFYAPLSEYKPRNASEYSPWSKQTSTMILAAAERQALRQATPLGGLLAEGEDESARAQLTTGQGDGSEPGWGDTSVESAAAVEAIIARAQALGHAGLSDRATAQMTLSGQPDSVVAMWCERTMRELDEFEGAQHAKALAGERAADSDVQDRLRAAGWHETNDGLWTAEGVAVPMHLSGATKILAAIEAQPTPEAIRKQLGQVLDRIAAEEEAGADEAVMADLYAEQERLEGLLGDKPGDEQTEIPL